MRSFWQEMPMLRIVFALVTGIALELAAENGLKNGNALVEVMWALLILAGVTIVITTNIKDAGKAFRLRAYNGLALSAVLLSFGYLLTYSYSTRNESAYMRHWVPSSTYIATIAEPPVQRQRMIVVIAEVSERSNENMPTHQGKVLLNIALDSLSSQLTYGDVLVFNAPVREIDGAKNPEEFDYKQYQANHNIYNRAYIKGDDWKLVDRNQGNFFFTAVYKLRDSFLQVIRKYVKDENDFGVASAIMLGYRDYINADVMRAYASSGVIHVLSVSGFHVAIMFFMLNLLLRVMDERGKKLAIVKAVLIISFIWFYACLTGLSPPVLRSALMFTMVQVGLVFFRNRNMYNLVTGSAVVLLLFNPYLLLDVGFQLTYLAVVGIIYLQPRMYKLLPVKNWLLDKIWLMTAVSIAAQITTVPLSLYYFHQFPNLFLLSNLVVIPLSEVILVAGTILFAVGQIPIVNDLTGWVFNSSLVLLNKFIFIVDSLPIALMKGISLTTIEVVLIYILVVLGCWLAEERKPKVFIASLVLFFSLCSFRAYKTITQANQKQVVVYSIRNHRAIAFISGTSVQYDFDEDLNTDTLTLQRKIKPHWYKCGIEQERSIDTTANKMDIGRMVFFEGKRILILEHAPAVNPFSQKLKADLVIITGSPRITVQQLKSLVDFGEVVFDSSNSPWRVKDWKTECNSQHIAFTDVNDTGAYILPVAE